MFTLNGRIKQIQIIREHVLHEVQEEAFVNLDKLVDAHYSIKALEIAITNMVARDEVKVFITANGVFLTAKGVKDGIFMPKQSSRV